MSARTTVTRRSRRIREIALFAAIAAAIAGFLALRAYSDQPSHRLTMIAVQTEPGRTEAERADVTAELHDVKNGALLVTTVRDGVDAPAYVGSLACGADVATLTCNDNKSATERQAAAAVDTILGQKPTETLDIFASLRQLADQLATRPAGAVEIWLNATPAEQNAAPVNFAQRTPTDITATMNKIVAAGAWIENCRGWSVHVVAPGTGNVTRDDQLKSLWSALLERCGGHLASWTERWLDGNTGTLALPDITDPRVEAHKNADTVQFVLHDVLFDIDSAALRAEASSALQQITNSIEHNGRVGTINVVGYTDDTGTPAYNQQLSEARANAVRAWLIGPGKVPPGAVVAKGDGEADPRCANTSAAGRACNRRVVITVTTKR